MIALQYDETEQSYYLIVGDREYGPFDESELEEIHNVLYAHFS